jgi:hypothetical protein
VTGRDYLITASGYAAESDNRTPSFSERKGAASNCFLVGHFSKEIASARNGTTLSDCKPLIFRGYLSRKIAHMFRPGPLVLVAALMLAARPSVAQINNGGFENPSDIPPALGQWQYVAGAIRDSTKPRSGSFAANLDNLAEVTNANVQQQTAVGSIVPGTEYALSFWAQANYGASGIGQVQLAFLNSALNILSGSPQFINIPPSANYVSYGQNFTAPANASALFLGFNAVTGAVMGATSHVYIDDVSFAATSGFAPADFNHDTKVDGLDLAVWKGAFGSTTDANADGDADSDGNDFLLWQRSVLAPAAPTAVPEPGSFLSALAALVPELRRRQRR